MARKKRTEPRGEKTFSMAFLNREHAFLKLTAYQREGAQLQTFVSNLVRTVTQNPDNYREHDIPPIPENSGSDVKTGVKVILGDKAYDTARAVTKNTNAYTRHLRPLVVNRLIVNFSYDPEKDYEEEVSQLESKGELKPPTEESTSKTQESFGFEETEEEPQKPKPEGTKARLDGNSLQTVLDFYWNEMLGAIALRLLNDQGIFAQMAVQQFNGITLDQILVESFKFLPEASKQGLCKEGTHSEENGWEIGLQKAQAFKETVLDKALKPFHGTDLHALLLQEADKIETDECINRKVCCVFHATVKAYLATL